ncbi:MAG: hypothetical protein Q8Q14_10770, partial [Gemmatimonadales bacterium]|nr:hypothetical protein [Gemmatimonadales bacterium]
CNYGLKVAIIDRLWHDSALDMSSAVAQNITQPALTRHTDGAGVELWLECHAAWGATPVTATVVYTNQAGEAGQDAVLTTSATSAAGLMQRFRLSTGDTGVVSVQSFKLTGTTGATGNGGLVLCKRLASIGLAADVPRDLEWAALRFPEIEDNACLCFIFATTAAETGGLDLDLLKVAG